MAKRHLDLCGGVHVPKVAVEWKEAPILRLALGKERHDVHLRLEHLSRRLCTNMPEVGVDLLELAAYVYAADQAVSRGGRVEIEYGERWRRNFRFEIPVRCLEVWRRSEIGAALTETLSFLSDDDYEFNFRPLRHPQPLERYLFDAVESNGDVEEVVLFSGGLDSLGGAVREVLQGHHKAALVSHRPNSKIYARQCKLIASLNERIASSRHQPLHIAVEINKGKRLGRDFNQRTRSFLFAAVAAVTARLFGLSRLRFYENGPISLNLPVSPQVVGGRASRTTHPRVLQGFEKLLTGLFETSFHVQNPFLWKTRKEVLEGIKAAGCGSLCALTSSCAHTWEQTTEQPHCGRCSQCLDRRLAALSAGLSDDEDPPQRYRSDVVLAPIAGADLILAERYVGHLLQAENIADAMSFLTHYPEVARVLRHVDESPAQAAALALDLYRRHAQAVRGGLAVVAGKIADPLAWRGVPVNSLFGIAFGRPNQTGTRSGKASSCREPRSASASVQTLVVDSESFTARLGEHSCFLGNTVEFRLLERLNRRPGLFLSIETLRASVWNDKHLAKNTIQRTICNLRRRLRAAGLTGVSIDGVQKDHYRLVLPA